MAGSSSGHPAHSLSDRPELLGPGIVEPLVDDTKQKTGSAELLVLVCFVSLAAVMEMRLE